MSTGGPDDRLRVELGDPTPPPRPTVPIPAPADVTAPGGRPPQGPPSGPRVSGGRFAVLQVAAVVLVLVGFAPWFAAGGSGAVSGFDLARTVTELGGTVDDMPPTWLGFAWYLLPVLGLLAWVGLHATDPPVRHGHSVVGGLGVLFCLGFMVAVSQVGADLVWGPFVALAASVALVVAGWPAKAH